MTIRALFFDLGGVLIKSVDKGKRDFWLNRLGVTGIQIAEAVWLSPLGRKAMVGQATEEEVWNDVGRRFSLTTGEQHCLEKDFRDESTLDVDLLSFICSMKIKFLTGVISDAFLSARSRLESVFQPGIFDTMVFSAEEGVVKPDPIIFQRAFDRLSVKPQEVIFVDDQPHIVAGALSLGINAIRCTNSAQVQQDILSRLDKAAAGA